MEIFIDSSESSLKGVLLHNTNMFPSIPIAHLAYAKESYHILQDLLEKVQYSMHEWMVCGDFKILTTLLGQQGGHTKFPCFLCEWDSRARDEHWIRKDWPQRESLTVGTKNVVNVPLVPSNKILLPPLHIKLGLMKQFVTALDKEGLCFQYLCSLFPRISNQKITAGVFDGPQIRKLMKDLHFVDYMLSTEKAAWLSFKEVVENFLGNSKSVEYEQLVNNMLTNFHQLGCNMSLKVHILHSHLHYFPENLGDFSEEQGERFHQEIKTMEHRYPGVWNQAMLADYCWTLKRDLPIQNKKKASKRTFSHTY
jgi:hypothetical protein